MKLHMLAEFINGLTWMAVTVYLVLVAASFYVFILKFLKGA